MKGLKVKQQAGVVLFLSLVMLLILTILGLQSVKSTSMQRIMARNARDAELAFQSAEVAVVEAEAYIETLVNTAPFEATNTAGRVHTVNVGSEVVLKDFNWRLPDNLANTDATQGFTVVTTTIGTVAQQPRYFIEFWRTVVSDEDRLNLDNIGQDTGSGRTQVFRVTALGIGGTEQANVIVRTTYGKKF